MLWSGVVLQEGQATFWFVVEVEASVVNVRDGEIVALLGGRQKRNAEIEAKRVGLLLRGTRCDSAAIWPAVVGERWRTEAKRAADGVRGLICRVFGRRRDRNVALGDVSISHNI